MYAWERLYKFVIATVSMSEYAFEVQLIGTDLGEWRTVLLNYFMNRCQRQWTV